MTTLDTNQKPVINYPLTLTTLTPVCVKSHDEPLSPLADYVQEGEQIHFIDQQKFLQKLTDPKLADAYANMVTKVNVQQQGKHEEFKQFLSENDIQVTEVSSVSRPYSVQGNLTQISRHIHSSGRVYIPGATLKGMSRNALFMEFCKNNEANIQPINTFLKLNKKEANLTLKNRHGVREVDAFFNAKEKNFLYNNASYWGFDDSNFIDSSHLSIIQLNRKRLVYKEEEKNLESLSVLQEVIVPGVTVNLNLFVKNTALDRITIGKIENRYNQNCIHPNALFKALNQASKTYIEFQKKHIQHDDADLHKTQLNYLESVVTKFSNDNQWALVCLGFGKSMLQNTIALSVAKNWEPLGIEAPTTFFTEAKTGRTIGWCVIGTEKYIPNEQQASCADSEKDPVDDAKDNYQLSEIGGCNSHDEVIMQVKSIKSKKPKILIAEALFKGEITEIEIIGLEHLNFQNGDWITVVLKDKSHKGEFKQARFKKAI